MLTIELLRVVLAEVEHTMSVSEKEEMYGDEMVEIDDVFVRVVLQIVFETLVVLKAES